MTAQREICVRLSRAGDTFLPFGGDAEETPDSGEVVYAVGNQVHTRRWTWRQSEHGKIGAASSCIFFPIDGFTDINKTDVLAARNELSALVKDIFGCDAKTGFVDAAHPEWEA